MNAIKELAPVHEAMLNWILQNPEKGLKEMSAYFGYTMPWLSRVMNSDIFKAQLAARQDEVFTRIADDIPAKLRGLADTAIERLGEKLQVTEDPRFIRETFDSVMEHMGFKARGPASNFVGTQQNVFVMQREDLARLRSGFVHGTEAADVSTLPAPARVQVGHTAPGSSVVAIPSPVHQAGGAANGSADAGDSL